MTTLPPEIIKKIIREYHSHPVADLLRTRVTFFPNLIPHDQDIICIGIHDGNNMYAPYHWSTKEHECFNHSMKMEELVVMNKIIDVLIKMARGTTWEELEFFRFIGYAIERLDPTYRHFNRIPILRITIDPDCWERLKERFRKRQSAVEEGSDGEERFVSSTVYSELQNDPESD